MKKLLFLPFLFICGHLFSTSNANIYSATIYNAQIPGVPFTPYQLSDLIMWYDSSIASNVSLNGSSVTYITDLTKFNNNAFQYNSTSSSEPIYSLASQNGLNTFLFTSNTVMTTTCTISAVNNGAIWNISSKGGTICYLIKTPNTIPSSTQYIYTLTGTQNPGSVSFGDAYLSTNNKIISEFTGSMSTGNTPEISSNILSTGTYYDVIFVFDCSQSLSSKLQIFINGVNQTNVGLTTTQSVTVGCWLQMGYTVNPGNSFSNNVSEWMVINHALTSTEIFNLDKYFHQIWKF